MIDLKELREAAECFERAAIPPYVADILYDAKKEFRLITDPSTILALITAVEAARNVVESWGDNVGIRYCESRQELDLMAALKPF